jgi:hypothetical protein
MIETIQSVPIALLIAVGFCVTFALALLVGKEIL